ncbi:hypothetical protein Tco_0301784 [Tanacetum coccineum]
MHQEEHLDSDAETEIDDNTIPYHQYLLDTEAQNVPIEVSADLQTQLDRHAKVNQEKCLEIETLKNELLQCKQEICRLNTHKVKLDLENKVRQCRNPIYHFTSQHETRIKKREERERDEIEREMRES